MKRMDDWWNDLSLEELREEFASLEEIECENQKLLAEVGHHCAQKSTDALTGLIDSYVSTRESLAIALRALERLRFPQTGDWKKSIIEDTIAEITKRGDYIPEGKG